MIIIKNRKIFYAVSLLLILVSVSALWVWGLKAGIDFKGGSLLSVSFIGEIPNSEIINSKLLEMGFEGSSVRKAGDNSYIIRTREINQQEKNEIIDVLGAQEKEFNSIGPILGAESIKKSYVSIVLVILAIVLFITFAFRKVSLPAGRQASPVSSWIYGLVTVIALAHDVLIPAGVFAVLGHFAAIEVDTLFVTALLVILGFSVHDTIVVFDRVRENLRHENEHGSKKPFEQIVGESINQTFIRSLNTSFTTLLAIIALYIVGPESTRLFALAMGIGIITGTYSSIFIASPLLVTINSWKNRK